MRKMAVNFEKKIREWDGFGVNYVETAQTPDYQEKPQDYGGFSILSESSREKILNMIFGEDGLQPSIIKMFLDPFHQREEDKNLGSLLIASENYDHESTTKHMMYFVEKALEITREREKDLTILTTLYSPPGWMTKQKFVRGRDLDPKCKNECAKYITAWAKYLKEVKKMPVKYVSLHNEGEAYYRWSEDGNSPNWEEGHDYNLFWSPEQVVEFLKVMRIVLDANGLSDVLITPGETTNWYRFSEWGYAPAIGDDKEALKSLGLITSHGFINFQENSKYFGDYRSVGIDILRTKKGKIPAWTTSLSWGKMDVLFVNQIRNHIYSTKVNAIIPWAVIQWEGKWYKGDPNPGTAFKVFDDGTFEVTKGYYLFKHVCSAGQAGMSVANVISNVWNIGLIGFSSNGTKNPDSFVVMNISDDYVEGKIEITGSKYGFFNAFVTTDEKNFENIGKFELSEDKISYRVPPKSVTTFFGCEQVDL